MMGISRKLPDKERARLKQILKQVMPGGAGVIVRTAAEGASRGGARPRRLAACRRSGRASRRKAKSASAPELLYSEPDLTIRVIRDIFNEDFSKLVVSGNEGWDLVNEYVRYVAPHLADRLERCRGRGRVARCPCQRQLTKALDRKVWLPSGGSLVIDTTEAMTVVNVNTGKFTGQGGNLEETVTRNNLEAAEEIVRQLRLRDVGGIIVIDFIDMVLESNRELVLRRLLECLARDRTKHQVAEVTSLGLVQMTRKRVGAGLLEAFSEPCECCNGRGVIVSLDLADRPGGGRGPGRRPRRRRSGRQSRSGKNGKESSRRADEDRRDRRTAEAVPDEAAAGGDAAGAPTAGGDAAGRGRWPDGAGRGRTRRGMARPRPMAPARTAGRGGPAGRRRRRAATGEQGPPEPVRRPLAAGSPDGSAPGAQESIVQAPDPPAPQAGEPGSVEPSSVEPGSVEPEFRGARFRGAQFRGAAVPWSPPPWNPTAVEPVAAVPGPVWAGAGEPERRGAGHPGRPMAGGARRRPVDPGGTQAVVRPGSCEGPPAEPASGLSYGVGRSWCLIILPAGWIRGRGTPQASRDAKAGEPLVSLRSSVCGSAPTRCGARTQRTARTRQRELSGVRDRALRWQAGEGGGGRRPHRQHAAPVRSAPA